MDEAKYVKHDCRWVADNSGAGAREAIGLAKCAGKSNREAKLQFSRGLGNQKVGKPKKTRENQKKIQRSWWIGGSSQESPNIVFFLLFCVFSRFFWFFGFSPWGLSPKSHQILFFLFFFLFSPGFFIFFILHGASPQRVPNYRFF